MHSRLIGLPALLLSALLQLSPLVRVATADAAALLSPVMAIIRWAVGAAAVAGSYHAVSGATTVTVTQGANTVVATANIPGDGVVNITLPVTNGVAVGYRFNIQVSAPSNGNSASYSMTGAPPGLTMGANTGVLTGITPTNAATYTFRVTRWKNQPPGRQSDINSGYFKSVTLQMSVVDIAPVITVDPTPITVNAGEPASLTVSATGSNLAYRWIKDGIEAPLSQPGATNSTLTFAAAQTVNSGNYQVRVSNSGGNALSAVVKLTVNAVAIKPAIAGQSPALVVVHPGEPVTLFVNATGTAPLAYVWHRNGQTVAGASGAELPVTEEAFGEQVFFARVTNAAGSAESSPVTVRVRDLRLSPPTLTANSLVLRLSDAAQLSDRRYRVETRAGITRDWIPAGTIAADAADPSLMLPLTADAAFFRLVPQ